MSAQHDEFQDRIARILSGQGATKATVYVGQEISFAYVPANRQGGGGLGQVARNAGHALTFPACILAGIGAHGMERYADFVLRGLPRVPQNADVEMMKVAMTSLCIAIVLTHLLGLRERALLVPKILGVAAGMLFFHNFVHLWPHLFDRLFSPLWVAKVTAMTEPQSLLFRGISIAF
jgi:hypothetical protein